MCRATLGATPVKRCTAAASSIFSYASRGTPSWAYTLKRVPELPNAHDGVSIRCVRSARSTRLRVSAARQVDEERRHLSLPPAVHVGRLHRRPRGGQIVGVKVADQQPVPRRNREYSRQPAPRSASSISSQTAAWRRQHSSIRAGSTRRVKQMRRTPCLPPAHAERSEVELVDVGSVEREGIAE